MVSEQTQGTLNSSELLIAQVEADQTRLQPIHPYNRLQPIHPYNRVAGSPPTHPYNRVAGENHQPQYKKLKIAADRNLRV
jgi:hypothetical protein